MEWRTQIKKIPTVNTLLIILFLFVISCGGSGEDGTGTAPSSSNPPSSDPGAGLNEFEATMLSLINEGRAEGRNCGDTFFPAAPPVGWDTRIENAALNHSIDMAENQNFSHIGTDGSGPGDRLLMEGYDWSIFGETILVGLDKGANVIDNWLNSPDHCEILMNPDYEEVGVGAAVGIYQGNTATYWTLDLATEKN